MTEKVHNNSTVAQRLAEALRRHSVDVIFGQSLPSALVLAAEDLGIRQISYRTENAGGAMADAYARISGKVGIVTAQNGPAATLLVPPLAEALKSSVPIIALVQDVDRPTVDRNAFQEIDHIALFAGVTKWVRKVTDGERIEDYVDRAFSIASSGRPGPTVLLLPADVLKEVAKPPPFNRRVTLGHWPIDRTVADPAAIKIAADRIANASNPLVVAGGGAHASGAAEILSEIQQEFAFPVAYSVMGKGIVNDRHPLTVGLVGNVMGTGSIGKHTRSLIDMTDVVLVVGSRTDQNTTDNWALFPSTAQILHIDVDPEEVGRTYESLRLIGDARLTLEALRAELRAKGVTGIEERRSTLSTVLRTTKASHEKESENQRRSDAVPIRPERIMAELQELLTPEMIVVADASYSSVWISSCLDSLSSGMRFITPRGLAGLGWGFPMALGAKIARLSAPVVCLVGDGGFGHCWAELETATRMQIPVVVIVLNNGVLGYQKEAETVKFGRYTSACHFSNVDHAAIAQACGVESHRVDSPADLRPRLESALRSQRPVLLDVVSDPNAYPPINLFEGALNY